MKGIVKLFVSSTILGVGYCLGIKTVEYAEKKHVLNKTKETVTNLKTKIQTKIADKKAANQEG